MCIRDSQVGQSILNDLIQQDKNEFLLVTIFHQYRTTNKWQFSTGLNFNASSFYTNSLRSIGPSIQINKIVLENKLNLSLQFADSEIYQESSHSHRAINLSSQAAFTLGTHSIQAVSYTHLDVYKRQSSYLLSDCAPSINCSENNPVEFWMYNTPF